MIVSFFSLLISLVCFAKGLAEGKNVDYYEKPISC